MRWPIVLALTVGIATSACGSGTGPSGSGTLRMTLKDSPFSDAMALVVTFTDVSVHLSDTPDGTWTTVTTGPRACDLKRLVTAQDVLGTATITAGHYTQIRLLLASAVMSYTQATSGDTCAASFNLTNPVNVTIPSGEVKLNRGFDISPNSTTSILLDVAGGRAMRELGKVLYSMASAINIVTVAQYGFGSFGPCGPVGSFGSFGRKMMAMRTDIFAVVCFALGMSVVSGAVGP